MLSWRLFIPQFYAFSIDVAQIISSTPMTQGKRSDISREALEALTETLSDIQIAKELNFAVSTVFSWRRKYGILSFKEKTGKRQDRTLGMTLEPGEGVPHKSVFSQESRYFEHIDTPSKAYFLGLIVTDGHLRHKGDKYFSIELKHPDYAVLKTLAAELQSPSEVKTYIREDKNNQTYGRLRIYNSRAIDCLRSLGITDDNTKNKAFRELYPSLRPHYLRGVLDGDGCIKAESKTLYLGSCSLDLIQACEGWANEYLKTTCSVTSRILNSNKQFYNLTFGGKPKELLTWLYKDNQVSIERKKEEAMRWINS